MLFCFLNHPFDVFLGKRGTSGDGHRLFLVGALIFGRNVDDTVGIDVEGHLHLGNSPGGRSDISQLEVPERFVVLGEVTLTLEHLDRHGGLIVISSRERFAALGRDRGVALDQLGHDPTLGLDTEAQGSDINQQNVFTLAHQHTSLQSSSHRDNLIGVDTLVGFATAGQLGHQSGDRRHPRRATHHDDVRNLGELDTCFFDDISEGLLRALEKVFGELFELRTGKGLVQVGWSTLCQGQVGQRNLGAGGGRKLFLRLLSSFFQTLLGDFVF